MIALINAEIYEKNETALLIDGNSIRKIGNNEEILKETGKADEVIDLKGMFVLPGFHDGNVRLAELGHCLSHVQLYEAANAEEAKALLEQAQPENGWVLGRGYGTNIAPWINREFLDEAVPEWPAALVRAGGEAMAVNTKALEKAGIKADTVLEGGRIDHENGILEGKAMDLVRKAVPEPSEETIRGYILKACSYLNEHGITSADSDDFVSMTEDYGLMLRTFGKMAYQGQLNVRVTEHCQFRSPKAFARFLDEGYTMDMGDDWFRIGPLKLEADGDLASRTALLRQAYHDDPMTDGLQRMEEEEMRTFVMLANRFNMSTVIHACGDSALDLVLDIFDDEVLEGNPLHHGILHNEVLHEDQLRTIQEKKYVCFMDYSAIDTGASFMKERIGRQQAKSAMPFRSLYQGTLACGGSGSELPDVLKGIRLAVTRTSLKSGESLSEDEALTIKEAVDSFTVKGAEADFADDRLGRIEEGYLADLTVLDRNILKAGAEEVTEANVMYTFADGRKVYER